MVVVSVCVGVICGFAWGSMFAGRYRDISDTPSESASQKSSAWILARTSIIRYLLLAALLAGLVIKYGLLISWWAAGFLTSFWVLLLTQIKVSKQSDGTNPSIEDHK